jgi:hypothetical protein
MRWLRVFTSVTYFSKLLRIHTLAAFLQLEIFRGCVVSYCAVFFSVVHRSVANCRAVTDALLEIVI